jgi:hypothetical protein
MNAIRLSCCLLALAFAAPNHSSAADPTSGIYSGTMTVSDILVSDFSPSPRDPILTQKFPVRAIYNEQTEYIMLYGPPGSKLFDFLRPSPGNYLDGFLDLTTRKVDLFEAPPGTTAITADFTSPDKQTIRITFVTPVMEDHLENGLNTLLRDYKITLRRISK